MKQEYITNSSAQTKKLGKRLAKKILRSKSKKATFVIGLEGDLGGGKTTFLQGFAKGLGIKEKILSPTFVVMKKFRIHPVIRPGAPSDDGAKTKREYLYHIDCYRIEKPKELLDIGFKEIVSNPQNIVVIEWADRVRRIVSKNTLWIEFEFIDEKKRKITIKNLLILC